VFYDAVMRSLKVAHYVRRGPRVFAKATGQERRYPVDDCKSYEEVRVVEVGVCTDECDTGCCGREDWAPSVKPSTRPSHIHNVAQTFRS
jgi:hypothetical protein